VEMLKAPTGCLSYALGRSRGGVGEQGRWMWSDPEHRLRTGQIPLPTSAPPAPSPMLCRMAFSPRAARLSPAPRELCLGQPMSCQTQEDPACPVQVTGMLHWPGTEGRKGMARKERVSDPMLVVAGHGARDPTPPQGWLPSQPGPTS